jgi:agmatine deiminase
MNRLIQLKQKICSMIRAILLIISLLSAFTAHAQVFTTPPATPPRTMAEWEELDALVINWLAYPAILTEIVKAATPECRVIVCVRSQDSLTSAQNRLIANGVDMTQVDFFTTPSNTVWIRDYGPQCVYANGVDSLMFVDWIYNRNRPADNNLPVVLAQREGLPVYRTLTAPYDLVNTGGNYMCDGMGQAFASELIYRNNDQSANGEPSGSANDVFGSSNHTEAGIDSILWRYMGIRDMIKLPELPYDGIHHIDMHIKLLDEETLLVGEYPPNVSDGPQIEANLQYILTNYKTSYGRPYKVIRVPMPPYLGGYPPFSGNQAARYPTYVNAFFVNKTLVMPSYGIALDQVALDSIQTHLPGYQIKPINCNGMIAAGGAVHCITREVGVRDPLLIQHAALRRLCNDSFPTGYPVEATIRHRSGIAAADLWWSTAPDAGIWEGITMTSAGGDTWTATLPVQAPNTLISYYISAEATNGKTMTRPMTAPEGYWTATVEDLTCAIGTAEPTAGRLDAIFPNPARSLTCVPVHFDVPTKGTLRVVDMVGHNVEILHDGRFESGDTKWFLQADRYVPGIYMVVLEAGGTRMVQRLAIH